MEQIFIQKIYKLTEQIFSQQYEFEPTLRDLKNHLAKAERMESVIYEVETLNTIGILYAVTGNVAEQASYFKSALDKAYTTDNDDLIIKLNNNLGSTLLGMWQLDEAEQVLTRGIEVIESRQLRFVGGIYCYSNMVNLLMRRGQFDDARRRLEQAFELSHNIDLGQYSRIEYFQILVALYQNQALLDMHAGNYEKVTEGLQLADEQIQATGRADLELQNTRIYMLYALIGENDEAKAKQLEQTFNDNQSEFDADVALQTAVYLAHNRQLAWADRYAHMVIDNVYEKHQTNLITHASDVIKHLS